VETRQCIRKVSVSSPVMSILLIDFKIWAGAVDGPIFVVDIESGEVVRELTGHTKVVNGLVRANKDVWSCSHDKTIHVWDSETGECVTVLHGHFSPVYSLLFENDYVWSGSWSKSIIIYNSKTLNFVKELSRHDDAIGSLVLVNEGKRQEIWSGGWDKALCVWSSSLNAVIEEPPSPINMSTTTTNISFSFENEVWTCGTHGRIFVFNSKSFTVMKEIDTGQNQIFAMIPVDQHIFTFSPTLLKRWSRNGEMTHELSMIFDCALLVPSCNLILASSSNKLFIIHPNSLEYAQFWDSSSRILKLFIFEDQVWTVTESKEVQTWESEVIKSMAPLSRPPFEAARKLQRNSGLGLSSHRMKIENEEKG